MRNLALVVRVVSVLVMLYGTPLAAGFTRDPVNQTVPVNTTALFSCTPEGADSASVSWSVYFPDVKKFYVDTDPDHTEILKARGFTFSYNDTASLMNVSATALNNRTNCRCRIFHVVFGSVFSEIAYLTVLGPPLPPGVMASQPSPLEILLVWREPFTWPEFPILSYTIIETEVATGETMTFIGHTLNHSHNASRIATLCVEIRFTVLATSEIGSSDPAIITTGLPIAPENKFENFDTVVRFRSNGDPEVTITIKLPPVCAFQQAQLTLEVLQVDSNESMLLVTEAYFGAPSTLTFHITRNLLPNTNYTLIATVTTLAGNATGEWHFDTVLVPPSDPNMDTSLKLGIIGAIVGGVAGGVVLLVLVAVLIAISFCMVLNYKATKALQSSGGAIAMQECTYESIDDLQIMHTSTLKNQYQDTFPTRIIRPESPYQPMKSADPNTKGFSDFRDPLSSPHYTSAPCPPMPLQTDNPINDLVDGSGGVTMYLPHGAGAGTAEDTYVAMNGAGTPSNQHPSDVPDSNQASGEYRLSIC